MHARHRRALRGVVATALATTTAATAHTLAGGGAPAPLLVAATTTLAAPLGVALAGRRLRLWTTGATVVLAQMLLHVAFALTAGLDPSSGAGHAHHGALSVDAGGGISLLPDPAMAFTHALAAAVTIIALYRGERMLRALARGIRRLIAPVHEGVRAPLAAPLPLVPRQRRLGAPRALSFEISRRGPPASVVAA